MVLIYLAAIITANLLTAQFGPAFSIVTAFLFIGLDLVARDRLHDRWHGNGLLWKMGLLILSGSMISYLINADAGIIGLASCLAFGAAAIVDGIVYALLRDKVYLLRVNGSNVPAAAVDSLVFPWVAFGGFMPLIVLAQFVAKVLGGFVWSLFLRRVGASPDNASDAESLSV